MTKYFICICVILVLLLGSVSVLIAAGPLQSPGQTPFICTDEDENLFYCDTPNPTDEPTLTLTPSPSPTSTPIPTPIPTDTPTRTPTATTPPSSATPTQELTLPPPQPTMTPTPSPTVTPTATSTPDARCWGTTNANLNVRDLPSYTWLGMIPDGDTVTLQGKYLYYGEWWMQHYWLPGQVGYSHSAYIDIASEQQAACDALPDVTPPPTRAILQGAHVIGADGANVLLNYCRDMTTVKLFESVIHYADDFRACNPDIWIVCRYWTDDIAIDTDYNAQEAYNRIGDKFPADCDAAEWENEKAPNNNRDWERWSAFSIEAARLMAANRNMQYCAFGLGPGWPDFDKLQYMIEYLKWVDANPLPDGRYHCASSHAAMFAPWNRSDMPWVNDPYIAGRVYLIRDYIYEITPDNFDLYEWRGVWAITEIGLSDGYAGAWHIPFTCEELKQAYWTTHTTYQANEFPHAQHHWNFGTGGIWTDDSRCAGAIWG